MWHQRLSESRRRCLTNCLLRTLPAPSPHARSGRASLTRGPLPEDVAEALHGDPGFLWIDGAGVEQRIFSRPLAVISAIGGRVFARGPGGRAVFAEPAFDVLDAALAAWSGPAGGILVGFLGYELAAELEVLPPFPRGDFPDFWMGLFDACLAWRPTGWHFSGTDAWRGNDGFPYPPEHAEKQLQAPQRRARDPKIANALSRAPLRSTPSDSHFVAGVSRTIARIKDGELFQANLCRRLEVPIRSPAVWPLYLRMRASNSARYGACLRVGPSRWVLSMSPELFLKVHDGRIESRPIKGTRPRGKNDSEDARLVQELTSSEKDRAELAMIVDVVRNDFGRVCTAGSVQVESYPDLLSLPTVHHTSATITGRLRHGMDTIDLLRATFPPASITGAPKIHAIEVALEEENQRRGPAMGAIGWISLDGNLELSVAIRTAVIAGSRLWYCVGAGITADSDPVQELEETRAKSEALIQALGLSSADPRITNS